MPTTLPLDPGDDAEGQLKPIAEFALPAPPRPAVTPRQAPQPVASTPSTPAATPVAAAPQPVRTTLRQPAAVAQPGVRTSLHAPSLSLNRKHADAAAEVHAEAAHVESHNARKFTDDELQKVWSAFIDQHAEDRLLVNTMRVSVPHRTATDNVFEMVVESEIQVELITEAMPKLLTALRTALRNDFITIQVRANDGESSPLTWNEREVLASMIERHPTVETFVDDLGLSLL